MDEDELCSLLLHCVGAIQLGGSHYILHQGVVMEDWD